MLERAANTLSFSTVINKSYYSHTELYNFFTIVQTSILAIYLEKKANT